MRFVADENIDQPVVTRLREAGHEVSYVVELAPSISDEAVLDLANRQTALLITADKDFGELVFRQGRVVAGVILLRLSGLLPERKAEMVVSAVVTHGAELVGGFTVISPGVVRIRRRPQ